MECHEYNEIEDSILSNHPRSCFLWVAALHVWHVRLVRSKCVSLGFFRARMKPTAVEYSKHTRCCWVKVALNWANFSQISLVKLSFEGCTLHIRASNYCVPNEAHIFSKLPYQHHIWEFFLQNACNYVRFFYFKTPSDDRHKRSKCERSSPNVSNRLTWSIYLGIVSLNAFIEILTEMKLNWIMKCARCPL